MTNADAEHLFIHPGSYKKITEHLFIHPGSYKKITHAIRAMDTEAEGKWVAEARAYVGEELFDSLLCPKILR